MPLPMWSSAPDNDGGGKPADDDAVADQRPQWVADVPPQRLAARWPAAAPEAAVDKQTRRRVPIIADDRGGRLAATVGNGEGNFAARARAIDGYRPGRPSHRMMTGLQ